MTDRGFRRDERGITVLELVIVLAILSLVLAMFAAALLSVQRTVVDTTNRSISNDSVRAALQQIDRQVRSGNVFFPPTDNATLTCLPLTQCGQNLVIYTQTNANTEGFRCMQWRISGRQLLTRSWLPVNPAGTVSGWRIVADDIVNAARSVPAFTLQEPVSAGRLLTATIVTNHRESSGNDVRITASVNGRNTQYGFPTTACSSVPAP